MDIATKVNFRFYGRKILNFFFKVTYKKIAAGCFAAGVAILNPPLIVLIVEKLTTITLEAEKIDPSWCIPPILAGAFVLWLDLKKSDIESEDNRVETKELFEKIVNNQEVLDSIRSKSNDVIINDYGILDDSDLSDWIADVFSNYIFSKPGNELAHFEQLAKKHEGRDNTKSAKYYFLCALTVAAIENGSSGNFIDKAIELDFKLFYLHRLKGYYLLCENKINEAQQELNLAYKLSNGAIDESNRLYDEAEVYIAKLRIEKNSTGLFEKAKTALLKSISLAVKDKKYRTSMRSSMKLCDILVEKEGGCLEVRKVLESESVINGINESPESSLDFFQQVFHAYTPYELAEFIDTESLEDLSNLFKDTYNQEKYHQLLLGLALFLVAVLTTKSQRELCRSFLLKAEKYYCKQENPELLSLVFSLTSSFYFSIFDFKRSYKYAKASFEKLQPIEEKNYSTLLAILPEAFMSSYAINSLDNKKYSSIFAEYFDTTSEKSNLVYNNINYVYLLYITNLKSEPEESSYEDFTSILLLEVGHMQENYDLKMYDEIKLKELSYDSSIYSSICLLSAAHLAIRDNMYSYASILCHLAYHMIIILDQPYLKAFLFKAIMLLTKTDCDINDYFNIDVFVDNEYKSLQDYKNLFSGLGSLSELEKIERELKYFQSSNDMNSLKKRLDQSKLIYDENHCEFAWKYFQKSKNEESDNLILFRFFPEEYSD